MTSKRTLFVQINGKTITASAGETLLQAAERGGVAFPSGCRAGGCGACKCRLAEGQVKERTETSYLLNEDELSQGYILACQSVPRSDLRVEVDLAPRGARGRVVEQERVTHDITRLTVQLDAPMGYRSGQFAGLSVEGLEGVTRSYSFATPPRRDGRVSFFVRKVPGGQLSSLIHDTNLQGREARVDGPRGDFWLRPVQGPLLMVAGGSGLAPVLALLREAAEAGDTRPVTLLFGARERRDLYALDELDDIARRWRGRFRFVPVLSAEPESSPWGGERGLVTEKIEALVEPGTQAYLCGPPGMIDGAVELLSRLGVAGDAVHFDRFTTRADAAPAAPAASWSLTDALHYLKYFSFHAVGLFSAAAIVAGGTYTTAGLLSVLALYMLGDAVLGDDTSTPRFRYPGLLTAQLWMALPLLALIVFAAVWSVAPGDPLGFGAWLSGLTGRDLLAARDAAGAGHHVSAWLLTGLMIGMVGTIPAHELTHRTWDPVSMLIGRWLLAFSFDTSFSIEHVYGHHRYVSTADDPATAPRGRSVYFHIIASTLRGNLSAFRIEAARLARKKLPALSWRNAFLRGHLMSAALVALAALAGGVQGALFFSACALWGKALLEIVNYMEHYGMVRDPHSPVQPRHSWNSNRRVSSWTMFNLTRHSHHHAQGEVPYQDLQPYAGAPMMISGYLTTIVVALIPPLWHRLMTPRVLAWDAQHASDAERKLAAEANARSGMAAFRRPQPPTHHAHHAA